MFGFEKGIDIADDCQVLHRKNIVIKNIIFISNLVYTGIFMITSFDNSSNWVVTIILFPVTFLTNAMLKKMINKEPGNYLRQEIAMYMASFYMFLSAILLYVKLNVGGTSPYYLSQAGYMLLYYSLVVVSLYQDRKMLKLVFQWLIIIVTILHFTVTYPIINQPYATDLVSFVSNFFISIEFRDIFLRTVILILFMVVLYSIVSISSYMQEERKHELIKRRQVQRDYTDVVTEIFNVTLNDSSRNEDDKKEIMMIGEMSRKLASLMGEAIEVCNEVYDFSLIHIKSNVNFSKPGESRDDEAFKELKKQTDLGSMIVKRLQLERKAEDIIRAHMEGSNSEEFIKRMRQIQNVISSQIILICDMYVSLRSIRSYKKAYNHKVSIQYLEEQFRIYFDPQIFDRFIRFQDDFEKIYDEF